MKILSHLICLFILSISSNACQLEEFLGFSLEMRTPEMQIQQKISKLLQTEIEIQPEILCQLINKGYLKAASELYDNYFVMRQIPIGQKIKDNISEMKAKVSQFNDKLLTSDLQVQLIEPAFKWAQSRQFVFLHIKFAHRLDAPGCITVKVEQMEFRNNSLEMIAFGIQAHQPIKFHLNLTLYSNIIPANCSWNLDSVGTMFINITKAEETEGVIWKRLGEDQSITPPIWWEMKGTYKKDMDDFIKILEEEEDKIERLQEKERKEKRQKEKEARETKEANNEAKYYEF